MKRIGDSSHLAPPVRPDIAFAEYDDRYECIADLGGLDADEIEVVLSSGMLGIVEKVHSAVSEDREDFWRPALRYNMAIGRDVDMNRISAWVANGILLVTLGKVRASTAIESAGSGGEVGPIVAFDPVGLSPWGLESGYETCLAAVQDRNLSADGICPD